MEALAVDLQLLKAVLTPELKLSVGRELMARVASVDANGRGMLSLAGVMLEAELPKGLAPGQEIRLQVRALSPEKVVLGLQDQPPATVAQTQTTPLPGGGAVEVRERFQPSGGPGGGGAHTLALRYDAPALGAVDMHFVLSGAGLVLQVTLPGGAAFEAAQDASWQLKDSLTGALAMPVNVHVAPRYEPLDVYA